LKDVKGIKTKTDAKVAKEGELADVQKKITEFEKKYDEDTYEDTKQKCDDAKAAKEEEAKKAKEAEEAKKAKEAEEAKKAKEKEDAEKKKKEEAEKKEKKEKPESKEEYSLP